MRLRTLFAWHLASSMMYMLGNLMTTFGYLSFEYIMDEKASTYSAFRSLEGFGWGLLAFHVLPEIVIDMNTFPGRSRRLAHLRYGPTPWTNLGQSLVFATACFFQGSYCVSVLYVEQSGGNDGSGYSKDSMMIVLNFIAGQFWLLSGLLAGSSLGFRLCGCCGTSQRLGCSEQFLDDIYIFTTVILCVSAYLETFWPNLFEESLTELGINDTFDRMLHFAVRCVWSFLGMAYVTGDIITMANAKSRRSSDNVDTPLGVRGKNAEFA